MLAQQIDKFRHGTKEDQLFYLACLKRVGRIAKVAYRMKPNPQFKQTIIKLKQIIDRYELR